MVTWHPPHSIPGELKSYKVTVGDDLNLQTKDVMQSPAIIDLAYINPNATQSVAVVIILKDGRRSDPSLSTLKYNGSVVIAPVQDLQVVSVDDASVVLKWKALKNVAEYRIKYLTPKLYTRNKEISTKKLEINSEPVFIVFHHDLQIIPSIKPFCFLFQ